MALDKFKSSLLLILLCFWSATLSADSEQSSAYIYSSNLGNFADLAESNAFTQEDFPNVPKTFRSYIAGLGALNFNFSEIKRSTVVPKIITENGTYEDHTPVYLLKGWVKSRSGIRPAAASLTLKNGQADLVAAFIGSSRIRNVNTFYRLNISNLRRKPIISMQRTKSISFAGLTCGANAETLAVSLLKLPPLDYAGSSGNFVAANSGNLQEIELSLHVDQSYASTFGTSTSFIQARVNEAEVIYENQLGLTYTIKRLEVDTTLTFASSKTLPMLTDFQTYLLNRGLFSKADLFHLFTARDLQDSSSNSGPIGVAVQASGSSSQPGVVCRFDNQLTIGITERKSGLADGVITVTVAHEFGHNFSAEHVASGIMVASLGSPLPESFSSTSVSQITDYVSNFGSCLTEVTPTPTASPSPSPSPGGGGSGGSGSAGGPGMDPVGVTLSASVSNAGLFSAEIELEETPSNCTYELRVSTSKSRIGYGTIVASSDAVATTTSFTTQVNRKLKRLNKKGKRIRMFIMAVLNCEDSASGASNVVKLAAQRIKSSKQVGPRRWIADLKQALGN